MAPRGSNAGGAVDCSNPTAHPEATITIDPVAGQPGAAVTVGLDVNYNNTADAHVEAFLGTGSADINTAHMIGEGTLPPFSQNTNINGQVPNLAPGSYSVVVCWAIPPIEGNQVTWRWDSAAGFTIPATVTPVPPIFACSNPVHHPEADITFDPESAGGGSPITVTLDNNDPVNPTDSQVEAFLGTGIGDIDDTNYVGEDILPQQSELATILGLVPDLQPGDYSVIVCWAIPPIEGNQVEWRWNAAPGFTIPTPTPTGTSTFTPVQSVTPTHTPTPTPTPSAGPVTNTPALFVRLVPGARLLGLPQFRLPRQVPPAPDVWVENMEITQSAQCLNHPDFPTFDCDDNEIAMIARRYTWIRVYVRNFNSQQDVPNVPVRLEIERNGQPYTTLNGGVDASAGAIDRNDINATANFMLYCDVCLHGDTLTFRAIADPDGTLPDPDWNNNYFPVDGPLERVLIHRRPLTITIVPFAHPNGTTASVPSTADLLRFLTRAFPVNHSPAVNLVEAPTFAEAASYDAGCIDNSGHHGGSYPLYRLELAWLAAKKVKAPDQVVGLLPPSICPHPKSTWRMLSDPLWAGGQGMFSLLHGYNGLYYYTDPTQLMAQAIGRNLGRRDPCGSVRDPDFPLYYNAVRNDPGWPYPIEPPRITQTGIETDATIIWVWLFPIPAYHPVAHAGTETEIMQTGVGFGTRCSEGVEGKRWVSPYTYSQLFCALSFHATTSLNCRQGNVGSLIPVGATDPNAEPASAQTPGPSLVVSATLNPDGSGQIEAVQRLDDLEVEHPVGDDFCVESRDGGVVSRSQCWDAAFDPFPENPDVSMTSQFTIFIPWIDGVDEITLRKGAVQLDTVQVSATAPTITVTAPSGGGLKSGTQAVQWTAQDADGDTLEFTVLYSHDAGTTFTPIASGLTGSSLEVDLDSLPGGESAFFQVLASDNTGNTTTANGATFEVAGKVPRASIITPEDGAESAFGAALSLSGSASDLEDGAIEDGDYEWRSSIDGKLGEGPAIIVEGLSAGLHTITLEVRDSDGLSGSFSIEVFIGVPSWVDVKPDSTIGLAPGSPVMVHVELPYGTDIQDLALSTFRLKVGDTSLAPASSTIGDGDSDGMQDVVFTFNSNAFFAALPDGTSARVLGSGSLDDGTPFRGYDLVHVGFVGDVNCDQTVDVDDSLQALLNIAGLDGDVDCLFAGDGNCDQAVDVKDIPRILSATAGLGALPAYCSYHLSPANN